jgi:hypothetical protein
LPVDRPGGDDRSDRRPWIVGWRARRVEAHLSDSPEFRHQPEAEQLAEAEPDDRGAVRVGDVALDLGVGVVVKQSLEHRGDFGGRAGLKLAVDAELLFLDVPLDHHALPERIT